MMMMMMMIIIIIIIIIIPSFPPSQDSSANFGASEIRDFSRMRFSPFYDSFRDSSMSYWFKKICVLVSSNWGPFAAAFKQYPWNSRRNGLVTRGRPEIEGVSLRESRLSHSFFGVAPSTAKSLSQESGGTTRLTLLD